MRPAGATAGLLAALTCASASAAPPASAPAPVGDQVSAASLYSLRLAHRVIGAVAWGGYTGPALQVRLRMSTEGRLIVAPGPKTPLDPQIAAAVASLPAMTPPTDERLKARLIGEGLVVTLRPPPAPPSLSKPEPQVLKKEPTP